MNAQQMQGLELEAQDVVLVKFYFNRRDLIPVGIPEKGYEGDEHRDLSHQLAILKDDQTQENMKRLRFERHRRNRVDTGDPVFGRNGVEFAQADMLRTGLANNEMHLVDVHWYKRRKGHRDQHVVVLVYRHEEVIEERLKLSRETMDALRKLAAMVWSRCYAWDNPTGVGTVNFTGHQPEAPIRCRVVTRAGSLTAESV